jgi:DNA polymerase-3 subunit delta
VSSKRPPRKKSEGLSSDTLLRQIKERQVHPLYLFLGEETYLQRRAVDALRETIDEACRSFNVSVFTIGSDSGSGSKTTAAHAVDAANQLPMMAFRRLVIVREFDKIKEDEYELVLDYLKRPAATTTVVFQAVSADQRRKLTTALMKSCTVVSFAPLRDDEARRWVDRYVQDNQRRIEPRAVERLVALAGNALSRLVNELEKLTAFAGEEVITEAAVLDLVARSREHTSWELWDAIIRRDGRRAMRLIKRLLDDGDTGAPLLVLGALAGLYRRMLVGKEALDRAAGFDEFSRAINQWGPNATAWKTRLSRTPRAEIVNGLRRIAQVDNAIKNAEATPRLQMEFLVAELLLPAIVSSTLKETRFPD